MFANMPIAKKLFILFVFVFAPQVVLTYSFISRTKQDRMAHAETALIGLDAYVRLKDLLLTTQRLRSSIAAFDKASADGQIRIEAAERDVTNAVMALRALPLNEPLSAFMERVAPEVLEPLNNLIDELATTADEDLLKRLADILYELQSLIEDFGYFSKLNASGEYDETAVAQILLNRLPVLTEHVSSVRTLSALAVRDGRIDENEAEQIVTALGQSDTQLRRLGMKIDDLVAIRPDLQGDLGASSRETADAVNSFLQYVINQILRRGTAPLPTPLDVYDKGTAALSGVTLFHAGEVWLKAVIEERLRQADFDLRSSIAFAILSFTLMVAGAYYLSRYISRRLTMAKTFAAAIAGGERDLQVDDGSRDDFGQLLAGLQSMLAGIKRVESDLFAKQAELEQSNWLINGQLGLFRQMSGDLDTAQLANRMLNYVCPYVDAAAAALYLDPKDGLRLEATYGMAAEAARQAEASGLARQAMEQGKAVALSGLEPKHLAIATLTGKVYPSEIVAWPLEVGSVTIGAFEVGSIGGLSAQEREFLEVVVDTLALSLMSARNRDQASLLLVETRSQAEELKQQQEELRATNEALSQKSAELQKQQTELEQTNQELEEQRTILEEQKERLESMNISLEQTRLEIEEKARSLELANRYKSEFLANISHELRTPLNSILILSRVMTENQEGHLTEEDVEAAETIHSAGSDLLNLINDILDLAKVEAGKLTLSIESVAIDELAEGLARLFRAQIQAKKLTFSVVKEEGLPKTILSDGQRLEQILKNFLANAVKFTEAGSIELSFTRPVAERFPGIDPSFYADGLAINVKDTGIGIAVDKQELIFEAFQQQDGTVNRRYGGTGLGLSIARALARLLGGVLHLASREGEGSVFTLILPMAYRGSLPEDVDSLTVSPGHGRLLATSIASADVAGEGRGLASATERTGAHGIEDDRLNISPTDRVVLVIEDDAHFAKILWSLCHEHGLKCLLAGSGEAGLADARRYLPQAILLDYRLPGMDGHEVLDRLKSDVDLRSIPVHMMSAEDLDKDLLRAGAIGILQKPADRAALAKVLASVEERYATVPRKVLLVEDKESERLAIRRLLASDAIELDQAASVSAALAKLKATAFDCVILDLNLVGESGFDLLSEFDRDESLAHPPVIIYTGQDLTQEEVRRLEAFSRSVIIKGTRSPDRLLDEITLFLHKVGKTNSDARLPPASAAKPSDDDFVGRKVLIVDDDMRNVYSLRVVLKSKRLQTIVGKTGREALERLAEHPDVDLVLMDVMMPEMDGLEAIKRIRAMDEFQALPIIAMTAKAMRGDREKCLAAGANDHLVKPVDLDQLFSLLRVWLTPGDKADSF